MDEGKSHILAVGFHKKNCVASGRFTQSVSTGPRPQQVPGHTNSAKLKIALTNYHTVFMEYWIEPNPQHVGTSHHMPIRSNLHLYK